MIGVEQSRVLVTGAGGFIGSHLVDHLVSAGAEVTALVQYNSRGSVGWLERYERKKSRNIEIVQGNLCNAEQLDLLVERVDIVFNLAALIGIPYSYVAPKSYFDVNLGGTVNILEAIRRRKDKILIQMSTSEVYGSAVTLPISESHPLQAQSPYSASKIGAEAAAISYFSSFDVPVIIPRVFNNYGPRQSERAIIANIISQALVQEKAISLGNVNSTRDFVFVGDTCRALCDLVKHSDKLLGKTINIGTGNHYSIREVAKKIFGIMEKELSVIEDSGRMRPERSEVDNLQCDNSQLTRLIGKTSWTSLEAGLRETIEWKKLQPANVNSKAGKYVI